MSILTNIVLYSLHIVHTVNFEPWDPSLKLDLYKERNGMLSMFHIHTKLLFLENPDEKNSRGSKISFTQGRDNW